MVNGFVGDDVIFKNYYICAFIITNACVYDISMTFLRRISPWFNEMRKNPYENRLRITFNCLVDVLLIVMPGVVLIYDYA